MKATIVELLDILEKETDCYQKMRSVLADEEKSIGLAGRDRFDRVQQEKEALVARLKQLEDLRRRLVDKLAPARRVQGPALTVSELAGMLGSPDDRKLLAKASRLRSLIREVQASNSRNQQRIEQYLSFVKGSLRLLTDLLDSSPVYQKPGTRQPMTGCRPGAGRLIRGSV